MVSADLDEERIAKRNEGGSGVKLSISAITGSGHGDDESGTSGYPIGRTEPCADQTTQVVGTEHCADQRTQVGGTELCADQTTQVGETVPCADQTTQVGETEPCADPTSQAKSESPTLNASFNAISLQLAGEDGLHSSLDNALNVSVPRSTPEVFDGRWVSQSPGDSEHFSKGVHHAGAWGPTDCAENVFPEEVAAVKRDVQ
ncbi:hypothetical protein U1Q18_023961 [Sarracenia purpurea var. burkii]